MRGTPSIYFKSLNRPFKIFGINKSYFYLSVGICLPIIISARFSLMMDAVAIFVFLLLHTVGIFITRADSQMFDIYKRHVSYRNYYDSISGIHSKIVRIKLSVPIYIGKNGIT